MLVRGRVLRHFVELIKEAEERTIKDIKAERVQTEPQITDRFLARVEDIFKERGHTDGVALEVTTLRDKGLGASEKEFGADFCGVLNVDLPNFQLSKGFLSQAKMEGKGIDLQTGFPTLVTFPTGSRDLHAQVGKMLAVTPDSFVIIYSDDGFVVVPASSVEGLKERDTVYGKPVDLFFQEFLMCFIGDPDLKASDDLTLDSLRTRTRSRQAIMFQISKTETIQKSEKPSK